LASSWEEIAVPHMVEGHDLAQQQGGGGGSDMVWNWSCGLELVIMWYSEAGTCLQQGDMYRRLYRRYG